LFKVEAEGLRDTGDWKQFTLYTQGCLISLLSNFKHMSSIIFEDYSSKLIIVLKVEGVFLLVAKSI